MTISITVVDDIDVDRGCSVLRVVFDVRVIVGIGSVIVGVGSVRAIVGIGSVIVGIRGPGIVLILRQNATFLRLKRNMMGLCRNM